ncbi:hypothetical protein HanIR_Chr05g0245861 [Helianthus annuus]|nr:hypothetical protein HanIR_Chr05g0245861 [Helianthus annuus]
MAELNSQKPRTVSGGTARLNDHPGSPLNVVPHNLLPDFAFNEDEDALGESRVVDDPESISSEFLDLHQNGTNDDEDGVQNCAFTELPSTGIYADEEFYVHHTPNVTRMWCPNVPIVLKTVVGCVYETWKDVTHNVILIAHFFLFTGCLHFLKLYRKCMFTRGVTSYICIIYVTSFFVVYVPTCNIFF